MKRFLEWIGLKKVLHEKHHEPPLVSVGDMWWASIGENIGYEINGKSDRFSRPVIIHTKLSKETYLVIPVSTQVKYGSWYITFNHTGVHMLACLQQIRVIDYRRFFSKIGTLDTNDFRHIEEGFNKLYQHIPPPTC